VNGKYVQANGINIHYEEYGEGAPLILLHGGTSTLAEWQAHIPSFAPHFHIYALDSRAHGKTDNPSGRLSYRMMADDVAAFIKALDKEQGKSLNWLFEIRGVGDYGVSVHVASGEAYLAVQVAEKFLESVKQILGGYMRHHMRIGLKF
jgi:pimeloyl-ACP methyl ester carboxylesterase